MKFLTFILFLFSYEIYAHEITIGNWNVKINNKVCYAYSYPLKSLFQGEREDPYVVFNYQGKNQLTFTTYIGYIPNDTYPVSFNIENKSINLRKTKQNYSVTYSASQDTEILNILIKTTESYFYTKAQKDDNVSTDYYSTNGFIESINHLNNNCKN